MTIIIPSKNTANATACVRAIRAAGETARILIIDDGIDVELLSAEPILQPYAIISGAKPFCFARNVNLGIKAANRDDVVIMNDDALLLTPMGLTQVGQFGQTAQPSAIISAAIDNVLLRRGAVSFACVFIPRRIFDAVGMLDEQFCGEIDGEEIYGGEDDDFFYRARKHGFQIAAVSRQVCAVDHHTLPSTFRPDGGGRSTTATRKRWMEIHGFPMGSR